MNLNQNMKVMLKNTIQFLITASAILLIASCGSSNMTKNGIQIVTVSDGQAERISDAVNTEDNSLRLHIIRDIQDYASSQDPVFNNARGAAMLIDGEYQAGIALLRESVRVLLREDVIYINTRKMPEILVYTEQVKEPKSVSLADNREIVLALREFVQTGRDRRLLRAVERWPGSLSVPPVMGRGLPSLALETMNDMYGTKIIKANSIAYFNPQLNLESQRMRAVEKTSMNLLIGGILYGDQAVISEAAGFLQSIPVQYQTSESRFIAGLGLYLIGDNEWRDYINQRYIAMFGN